MNIIFHVFTDGKDSWANNLKEARSKVKKWKKEGYLNYRIYRQVGEKEEEFVEGKGGFPA